MGGCRYWLQFDAKREKAPLREIGGAISSHRLVAGHSRFRYLHGHVFSLFWWKITLFQLLTLKSGTEVRFNNGMTPLDRSAEASGRPISISSPDRGEIREGRNCPRDSRRRRHRFANLSNSTRRSLSPAASQTCASAGCCHPWGVVTTRLQIDLTAKSVGARRRGMNAAGQSAEGLAAIDDPRNDFRPFARFNWFRGIHEIDTSMSPAATK